MIKIYVACPYTLGDVALNVRTAMNATEELYELGYNAYNPLVIHFQHMAHPRHYNFWMKIDYDWVAACDAVLRLPGVSEGADMETEFAKQHNIPVFYSIEELTSTLKTK